MDIGEKLRTLRRGQKMTQEQLAEQLNVSAQAVSKWETGVSAPDLNTVTQLALLFHTTPDDLLDFDRRRLDEEVGALVTQSVPLRADPARAEAFYRDALRRYPNNEVLLNCLLMVIPNGRGEEKIAIAQRLLDCTQDDEIRLDVLRLLAQAYHARGEDAMAEACLAKLPELYFLKTEIAAAIRNGEAQTEAIRMTEKTCFGTLTAMLALRREEDAAAADERFTALLALIRAFPEYGDTADALERSYRDGTILDFYA